MNTYPNVILPPNENLVEVLELILVEVNKQPNLDFDLCLLLDRMCGDIFERESENEVDEGEDNDALTIPDTLYDLVGALSDASGADTLYIEGWVEFMIAQAKQAK